MKLSAHISDLKHCFMQKDFHTVITLLVKHLGLLYNKLKDRKKSLNFLNKEQKETIDKLKEGYTRMEN